MSSWLQDLCPPRFGDLALLPLPRVLPSPGVPASEPQAALRGLLVAPRGFRVPHLLFGFTSAGGQGSLQETASPPVAAAVPTVLQRCSRGEPAGARGVSTACATLQRQVHFVEDL